MTISLKSILPELAEVLGTSTDALYERQRALTREGLLESIAGKGPGSGVRATAETIAILLIGTFASVNLANTGPQARAIASAKVQSKKRCELTGEGTFKDALARILSDGRVAGKVDCLVFAITHGDAKISFGNKTTLFMAAIPSTDKAKPTPEGIRIEVTLKSQMVKGIAARVREILKDQ